MRPGQPDDAALDDPAALADLDSDGMLLAVATAGARGRYGISAMPRTPHGPCVSAYSRMTDLTRSGTSSTVGIR